MVIRVGRMRNFIYVKYVPTRILIISTADIRHSRISSSMSAQTEDRLKIAQ